MKDPYTQKLIKDVMDKHEICYAYNDSFDYYHKIEMTKEECIKFVNDRNQYKGGHWEVRPKGEYQEHFELLIDRKYIGDGKFYSLN